MVDGNLFSHMEFEDRESEREAVGSFISDRNESGILWVNGLRGSGKSYLVERVVEMSGARHVLVSVPADCSAKERSYLKALVKALQKDSELPLFRFLLTSYDHIATAGVETTKVLLKHLAKVDVDDLLDAAAGMGKCFVTEQRVAESFAHALVRYFRKRAETDTFVVVLDNFSSCDDESLEVIEQVISQIRAHDRIAFIVVTTEEELFNRPLVRFSLERVSGVQYEIVEPFQDYTHFRSMLSSGFKCETDVDQLAQLLYGICEGKPQLLIEVLRNVHVGNPSAFQSDEKPCLPSDLIRNVVDRLPFAASLTIPRGLQTMSQFEREILRIVCTIGIDVPQDALIAIAIYHCLQQGMSGIVTREVRGAFENLVFEKTLQIDYQTSRVTFAHDSDYLYYRSIFAEPIHRARNRWLSESVVDYLQDSEEYSDLVSPTERERLIARHYFIARLEGWEDVSLGFAESRFFAEDYQEAFTFFDSVASESSESLSHMHVAMLMESACECGEYEACARLFRAYEGIIPTMGNETKRRCLFAAGKAEHINLDARSAQQHLWEALSIPSENESRSHSIRGVLISSLRSTAETVDEARSLFLSVARPLLERIGFDPGTYPLSICKVLRNASFFLSNDEASIVLSKGILVASHYGDGLEEGFCLNNRGVVKTKAGDYVGASADLNRSLDKLTRIRTFEAAYPLQNLSTIALLRGDYSKALNLADKGAGIARSRYVGEALDTNRLVACAYLGLRKRLGHLVKKMDEHTFGEDLDNELVTQGNLYNLAIAFGALGNEERAAECARLAWSASIGTKSESRSAALFADMTGLAVKNAEPWGDTEFYTTRKFDPFLISIAHG